MFCCCFSNRFTKALAFEQVKAAIKTAAKLTSNSTFGKQKEAEKREEKEKVRFIKKWIESLPDSVESSYDNSSNASGSDTSIVFQKIQDQLIGMELQHVSGTAREPNASHDVEPPVIANTSDFALLSEHSNKPYRINTYTTALLKDANGVIRRKYTPRVWSCKKGVLNVVLHEYESTLQTAHNISLKMVDFSGYDGFIRMLDSQPGPPGKYFIFYENTFMSFKTYMTGTIVYEHEFAYHIADILRLYSFTHKLTGVKDGVTSSRGKFINNGITLD